MFDPKAEPCSGCGREVDECNCPPDLDDDFDPMGELTGYDPDWDEYETGDLTDGREEDEEIPPALG
jgi:hypothetical protein